MHRALGSLLLPLPPVPPRRRRRLRHKPLTEPSLKGQLRMRSPAGAFLMVGISVVLVGMTIAVVGYWPHRGHGGTGAGAGNTSVVGDMRREVVAGRHMPHSERLKLIGPVIMGIGLFIFICANTMLYENRDMETRQLMQKGLYSLAVGLPEGTRPEDGHCQHGDSQPKAFPRANAECVEGCYQVDLSCQPSPTSPATSLRSLRSTEVNLSLPRHAGAESLLSSAPLVGLRPHVHLHTPGHSRSLDLGRPGVLLLAPIKDRKNRSWPRLDHVSLVGYAKLESTGESSDQLLEPSEPPSQGEPLPSSWVLGMEQGTRV
uniref:Transmembrane protein 200B n=1 Tax=Serinus canaria TaxID=9135 RepID=A0A8C9UGK8_SERCA